MGTLQYPASLQHSVEDRKPLQSLSKRRKLQISNRSGVIGYEKVKVRVVESNTGNGLSEGKSMMKRSDQNTSYRKQPSFYKKSLARFPLSIIIITLCASIINCQREIHQPKQEAIVHETIHQSDYQDNLLQQMQPTSDSSNNRFKRMLPTAYAPVIADIKMSLSSTHTLILMNESDQAAKDSFVRSYPFITFNPLTPSVTTSIAADQSSVTFTSTGTSFTPFTVTMALNIKSGLENSYTGTTSMAQVTFQISELPAPITYAPTIATISMGLGQDYVLSLPLESDYAAKCSTFRTGFISFNPSNTLFTYTLSADLKIITFSSPATTFSSVQVTVILDLRSAHYSEFTGNRFETITFTIDQTAGSTTPAFNPPSLLPQELLLSTTKTLVLDSILSSPCSDCQINSAQSTSSIFFSSISTTQLDITSSLLGMQYVYIWIKSSSTFSGFPVEAVTGIASAGSNSLMRVLQVNVVKTFSPGPPRDIFMKQGDTKSINLGNDPDASCYEYVPSSIIIISDVVGLSVTPSASTIIDFTASQKGTFIVSLHVQPKSTCVQNYPNPSMQLLEFKVYVYNRYNPKLVPAQFSVDMGSTLSINWPAICLEDCAKSDTSNYIVPKELSIIPDANSIYQIQSTAAGIYYILIDLSPNPTHIGDYRPVPHAEFPKTVSIEITFMPVFRSPLKTATFAQNDPPVPLTLPILSGIDMTDNAQFRFAASGTPQFLIDIITFNSLTRTYTFTPTLDTTVGTWQVKIEAFPQGFTSPMTWLFPVIVKAAALQCVSLQFSVTKTINLAYEVGQATLQEQMDLYFPYDIPECQPTYTIIPEPAGGTIDTSVITMNQAMRSMDVYTTNPAKAVTAAYSVRVKAKWPPSPSTIETSNIFKVKVTLPAPPSPPEATAAVAPLANSTTAAAAINDTQTAQKTEAQVVENNEPVPDFTGSLAEIAIAEIKVRATLKDQTTKVELPRKYFRAKNLQITLKQETTGQFMTYRNGILYFRAFQKDVGTYSEEVTVAIKGGAGAPLLVTIRIRVLPPLKQTNMTCPFGNKPGDCMPKIKQITNGGVMTLLFPMPLESLLNETDFRSASQTLDIELKQQVPQVNTTITDWQIIKYTSQEVDVQLTITNPLYISFYSEELDKVKVVMLQPSKYFQVEERTFLIKDNYTLTGDIPQQKLNSTLMRSMEKTFGFIDSTMTSGMIVNIILALVIRAPMKLMWNMINTLQILTFMPMLNMQIPTNLKVCLETIKEVSNLSILPKGATDWILEKIGFIKATLSTSDQNDPDKTIKQLTQVLIGFAIGVLGLGGIVVMYYLSKIFPIINKVYISLRDKLIWGVFLTFFIKSFLKLYVNAAMGVIEEDKTQPQRLVPFIILLLMTIAPLFMLTGLVNLRNSFDEKESKRKYGALTLNIRTDSPQAYIFNFFFVFRRMLYGLSLAFLTSNPSLQAFLQIGMSLGHLLYVQQHLPYFERLDNLFEMGNELTILLVLTTSLRYADRSPSPEAASNWGFMQIAIISLNIGVNLGYFAYENVKLVYNKVKEYLERRRQRRKDMSVKIQPEPGANLGKSRFQDLTSTTMIMNHSFDAAAQSNITCGLGDFRDPLKAIEPTITLQKGSASHVKNAQHQAENQKTKVEEESDQEWNQDDHETPQGSEEENDDELFNEEVERDEGLDEDEGQDDDEKEEDLDDDIFSNNDKMGEEEQAQDSFRFNQHK